MQNHEECGEREYVGMDGSSMPMNAAMEKLANAMGYKRKPVDRASPPSPCGEEG